MTAVRLDSDQLALKSKQLLDIIIANPELLAHLHSHHLQFAAILFDAKIDELDNIDLKWLLERNIKNNHPLSYYQKQYNHELQLFYQIENQGAEYFNGFGLLDTLFKQSGSEKNEADSQEFFNPQYLEQYCILLDIAYTKDDTIHDVIHRFYIKCGQRSLFQMQLFSALFSLMHELNIKGSIDFRSNMQILLDTTPFKTADEQSAASKLHYLLNWNHQAAQQSGLKKIWTLMSLFIQYWTTFSYKNIIKADTPPYTPPDRLKSAADAAKRLSTTYRDEKNYLKSLEYNQDNKPTLYNRLLLLETQYNQIIKLADEILKQQIQRKIYLTRAELYLLDRIMANSDLEAQITDAENHFQSIYQKNISLSNTL